MNLNIFSVLFVSNFPYLCNIWPSFFIQYQPFDFIIVGGGAAGSVLANRLSENPQINVLLLEAGECQPVASEIPAMAVKLTESRYDWRYSTIPQKNTFLAYPNQTTPYPRGKALGGSTSINAMIYLRGNKNDFDSWAKMGLSGWSYDDVLPYILKSEGMTIESFAADSVYHNTSGPVTVSHTRARSKAADAFLKAAEAAGYPTIDLNAASQKGFMSPVFAMRDGSRCSAAKAYLVPAQLRPNLIIKCNSSVTNILFNKKKEAYGVKFQRGLHSYTVKASKEVILSAGAINSPQLLMLSGVGPQHQLSKFKIPMVANLEGVGENLQDHVGSGSLFWKVNCSECAFLDLEFYNPINILKWLLFRRGPLTIPYGVEGIGYMNTKYADKSVDWPDVQYILLTAFPVNDIVAILGMSKNILEKFLKPLRYTRIFAILPFLMRPQSRGYVRLQSKDPKMAPLIDLNHFSHPDDAKTMVEGIRMALELGNSEAFKPLGAELNPSRFPGCENFPFLSDEYLECLARYTTFIYFHAVGTCKMGLESDPMAVVDNELKVFGVKNLRVVDASVMPTIVSANTMVPTIMIAEKAADIIKQKYSL